MYIHVYACTRVCLLKKWSLLYGNLSVIHIHGAPIMNIVYAYTYTNNIIYRLHLSGNFLMLITVKN